MDFGFFRNFFSWDSGDPLMSPHTPTQPTKMKEFYNFRTWRPSFSVISWAVVTSSEKIYTLWNIRGLKRALQPRYDFFLDMSTTLSNLSKYFKDSFESTTVSEKNGFFDFSAWELPSFSIVSCVISPSDKVTSSCTHQPYMISEAEELKMKRSSSNRHFFRPYVSRCPWHTGARAFLSLFFPRYGHYCGPNWSSGKMSGSHIWDMRPIDWLDFCCYCHDMGYDTEDQAELLKADLAFLECLERPHMESKGDANVAYVYKTMCTKGLRFVLIPYRKQLLKMQSDRPTF